MKTIRKKIYKNLHDPAMVQAIIEAGGVNKIHRASKQNALFFALAQDVDIDVVRQLLEGGIDVNLQNKQGDTVVHLCDDLDKLAMILQFGPDLNLRNKASHTPIFNCNDHDKAKMLVDAGIDLNVCDDRGKHFLKSVNTMDFDLMKIFIDKGMYRFIEKRRQTLDIFFEEWSSIETQAYFENKLKTMPDKYQVKV